MQFEKYYFLGPTSFHEILAMTPKAEWKWKEHQRRYENRYGFKQLPDKVSIGAWQGVKFYEVTQNK